MSREHLLYVTSRTRPSEFRQIRFVTNERYSLPTSGKYVTLTSQEGRASSAPTETSAPEIFRLSFREVPQSQSSSLQVDIITLDSRSGFASFTLGPAPSPTDFATSSAEYFTYDPALTGFATPSRFYTFHKEKEAFLLMREDLMLDRTYIGKYVAVLHGRVVDSDTNKAVLAKRVYEKHGYVPIYITQVADTTKRLENPSPEIIRSS